MSDTMKEAVEELVEAIRLEREYGAGHRFDVDQQVSKLRTHATHADEIDEKLLGLGREARATIEVPRREGMSRGSGVDWASTVGKGYDDLVDGIVRELHIPKPHAQAAVARACAWIDSAGRGRQYAAYPADEVPKCASNVAEWTLLDALRFLLDPEPCPGSTMGIVRAIELAKGEPDDPYREHAKRTGAPSADDFPEEWAPSPGGKHVSTWTELDALRWVLRWAQVWHKQAGGYMASDTSSGLARACKIAKGEA